MKICIVGCGALGSVIAAHLARLGDVEVHAYDTSEEHTRAIRESGLQISGAAEFTVKFHATTRPEEIPACDFGIVATKSLHTRVAIQQSARIFGDSAAVCNSAAPSGSSACRAEALSQCARHGQNLVG